MKNLSAILNIVLFVAVAVLYALHFSDSGSSQPKNKVADSTKTAQTTESPNPDQPKTVFVNVDSLFDKFEYFKTSTKNLENETKQAERHLESRMQNLQGEAQKIQQDFQGGMLTQTEAKMKQQELMQKEQDIMQYRQTKTQELMERERALTKEIFNKITSYLNDYCATKGYQYVLGYSQGGNLLYAQDTLSITNEVIEGLNQRYGK